MLTSIFYFVLTLSILVTFHEYGHFWVARRCGVRVLRFSVGFGSPLWRKVGRDGTEYVVASIPLGGYVKMLDGREQDLDPGQQQQAFNHKSAAARTAIIAAGPLANFLLAAVVYAVVFVLGVPGYKPLVGEVQPDSPAALAGLQSEHLIVAIDGHDVLTRSETGGRLLERMGDTGQIELQVVFGDSAYATSSPEVIQIPIERWLSSAETPDPFRALGFSYWFPPIEPIIETVLDDSPAKQAGIIVGDRLLGIGGQPIAQWKDVGELLESRAGQLVEFEIERDHRVLSLSVNVAEHIEESGKRRGRIGVVVQMPEIPESLLVEQRYNVFTASAKGVNKTIEMVVFTLDSIKKMLVGLISPTHLGGPVTIAQIASMSAESGLVSYLQMLALLSISLGVFNLLPIPVLDGGHLLVILVETVIRQPVPERLLMSIQQVGMTVLLSIMAFAIYNDFARL